MTESLQEVYADERWGRRYGYPSSIYATGYHRGQDIRKQNAAKTASVSHNVLALDKGRVVAVTRKLKIGLTIVIDTGRERGRYESHSHLRGSRVKVGDTVLRGTWIADTDTNRLTAGTSWGGPHDHIVIGNSSDAAWNTARTTFDPRPFIRLARIPVPAKPAPAPASSGEKFGRKQITLTDLNLRETPGGKIITTIPKGTIVFTGKYDKGWHRTRVGTTGKTGWANSAYMTDRDQIVTAPALNLYASPKRDKNVRMKYKKGAQFLVMGSAPGKTNNTDWYHVKSKTNGLTGYMDPKHLDR